MLMRRLSLSLSPSRNWWAGGLAVLLVAASLFHGDGTFGAGRWLALDAALVLAAVWFAVAVWRRQNLRLGAPHLWALGLLAWVVVSLLWSSDPRQGVHQLLNTLPLVGVFFVAPYIARAIPLAVLAAVAGSLLLVAVLPEQIFGGHGNENFITGFLLLAAPLALLAWRGSWSEARLTVLVVLLAAAVYLVAVNPSRQEYFVVGVLVAAAVVVNRRNPRWVIGGLAALAALGAAVWLGWGQLEVSVLSRVELWLNTAKLISMAPLSGHGFGSFMYEIPFFQEWFMGIADWGPASDNIARYAGAAHNEYLQLTAELGIAGLTCAGLLVVTAIRAAVVRGGATAGAAVTTLLVASALAFIDLPAQNAATALLIALALGLAAGKGNIKLRAWRPAALPVLPLAVAFGFFGWQGYVAQVELGQAREAVVDGRYVSAVAWNTAALNRQNWDWRIRIQFPLTINGALKNPEARLFVPDEVQDLAYRVGQSASPNMPTLLIVRFEDLWATARHPNEAVAIYETLKERFPRRAWRQIEFIETRILQTEEG